MDISEFPALSQLNQTQIENLRGACDEVTRKAGEELIRRGEDGGDIVFLLEGELQVYVPKEGREVELVRLSAPAVVGEIELLTGGKSTASVRALSDSRIFCIPHEAVRERVADGDPATLKVMFAISKLLAGRLAAMTEKFVEIEGAVEPRRSDELRQFRSKLFSEWTF